METCYKLFRARNGKITRFEREPVWFLSPSVTAKNKPRA